MRWAGMTVAVIAAMALGQVITEFVPVNETADQPFVRTAEIGSAVSLRYADVEVTGVRAGPRIYGAEPIAAAGRFLIADVEIVATRESTLLLGVELEDGQGRRFAPTDRGAACPASTTAPAGVRWYAMFCFDVPKSALVGATLVVSKGDYGVNGSGRRRDDVARIDLGIDAAEARTLWRSATAWKGQRPGFDPMDRTPVEETS